MATEKDGRMILEVKYMQQQGTNRWKAETTDPSINRIPEPQDATPIIARWEVQTGADEKYTILLVSVQRDRRNHDFSPEYGEAWRGMVETANEIADREFKRRYPDAQIEHQERWMRNNK